MRITFPLFFVCTFAAVTAQADDIPVIPPVTYTADMSIEDANFAVENAIVGAGLVIDGTSHVGDMLARTKEDVGGTKDIFTDAVTYTFCSAQVSRQVMEADPSNVRFCPYAIFVYELADKPGEVIVGHQAYGGSMAPLNDLLSGINKDALMLD